MKLTFTECFNLIKFGFVASFHAFVKFISSLKDDIISYLIS